MKTWCVVIIMTLMLLLPIGVAAIQPDEVTTETVWAVAGGGPVPIKIQIDNATIKNNFRNVTVTLNLINESYGQIQPSNTTIDNSGNASFTFSPNTIKGNASINLTILFDNEKIFSKTFIQKIDHAEAKNFAILRYPGNQTVNKSVEIVAQITDRYGNPIDNRYESSNNLQKESLKYMVPLSYDGGFGETREKSSIVDFNDDGYANVTYYLNTISGTNYIYVVARNTVIDNTRWILINGIPDTPVEFYSVISSNIDKEIINNGTEVKNHIALPNGEDYFRIYYYTLDQYKNGVPNVKVDWMMKNGTYELSKQSFFTNDLGYVYLQSGTSKKYQVLDIIAIASKDGKSVGHSINDILEFKSVGNYTLIISPNARVIASRNASDLIPLSNTTIKAELLDSIGRGIENQNITFEIISEDILSVNTTVRCNSSFNPISPLSIINSSTNRNGVANTIFYALEFAHKGEGGYQPDARAKVRIKAEWNGEGAYQNESAVDFTEIEIKSYPFIRAEINIEPDAVERNQTFNVTISLVGDGYIPRNPIDVIFANSRGPSMLQGYPDPILDTRGAALIILNNLTIGPGPRDDRAGLWTFSDKGFADLKDLSGNENWKKNIGRDNDNCGSSLELCCKPDKKENHTCVVETFYPGNPKNYNDYATCETGDFNKNSLDINRERIEEALKNTTPWLTGSNPVHGSPIRYGLYKTITDINTTGRNGAVRAVIVLIDDNYKWFGDPLAESGNGVDYIDDKSITTGENWNKFTDLKSEWQNMCHYAGDNGIRLYVVAYATNFNTNIKKTYITLCNCTGGFFQEAPDKSSLFEAYRKILEDLMVYASVDTSINANFGQIKYSVLNISGTINASDEFTYEPIRYSSTNVTSWWIKNGTVIKDPLPVKPNGNYPNNTVPVPVNGNITYPYWINQSDEWKENNLSFYIGNISIGQIWRARFTLNATGEKYGIFKLFDPDDPCPIKMKADPNLGFGVDTCVQWPAAYIKVEGTGLLPTSYPAPIDIECINKGSKLNISGNYYNVSNISDLANISMRLKYNGTGKINIEYRFKYSNNALDLIFSDCNDAGYLNKAILKLPAGPYPPTGSSDEWYLRDTNVDITNKHGYYKVCIHAEEYLYPIGKGHTADAECKYLINNQNLGQIKIE